ncbi:MAG TPA: hypothetical protein VKM55_31050 [Candidatus Lokiarchaeia archaeon]|nr:hypothetical protein [Candidatus Lokiarchaeia archaeon]
MVMVAGIDFGSALVKATSGGADFVNASMIGEFNEGWSGSGGDPSWDNNICVQVGIDEQGQVYKQYFGELARLQSEVKRLLTKNGMIADVADVELAVKVALVILGIKNQLIDENVQDVQEIECITTVGLPVSTGLEKMKQLSQALKGIKEIVLENDQTKKIVQVRLNITSCMVVYGPYGSYFAMMQEFNESEAVDAVVADIGYGSTEILTVYGGRPNAVASSSITDLSLETLANRLAVAIQQQTGRIIRGVDLMRFLQDGKDTVIIAGETLDVSQLKKYYIEQIVKTLTDEIVILVSRLPPDARIKYYIFTGDGVGLFWNDLETTLYQKNLIQDINQTAHPQDYRISNARGFEQIARARFEKSST